MTPNEHEIEALRMLNGDIPVVQGAWLNACYEFLREMGLVTFQGEVTEKGKALLEERT